MTDLKKLSHDLTYNAGLALVEQYMKRLGISAGVDRKFQVGVSGIANSDILKSGFRASPRLTVQAIFHLQLI